MSSGPDPTPNVVRRRRRRHQRKGLKAVPKAVWVLLAACLAILLLIPVMKQKKVVVADPPSEVLATVSGSLGIVVSEDRFDRQSRTMKGILKNNSDQSYENVVVSYFGRDANAVETGIVQAIIPRIEARQTANFETEPLPKTAIVYVLRDIQAQPR